MEKVELEEFEESVLPVWRLPEFIFAKDKKNELIDGQEDMLSTIYDNCDPSITFWDSQKGEIYTTYVPVDVMAFMIIEKKEAYQRKIERYQRMENQFNQVFNEELSAEEQKAIIAFYVSQNPEEQMKYVSVLKAAEARLCERLGELHNTYKLENFKDLKEKRKQEIADFLEGDKSEIS